MNPRHCRTCRCWLGSEVFEAAEVNGDQREVRVSTQPAGAAAAPTGIPAGGQFGSGGPPAGLFSAEPIPPGDSIRLTREQYAQLIRNHRDDDRACNRCGSTADTIPVINGAGGWRCRLDCPPGRERVFPVLGPVWGPRTVPWALVADHHRQAMDNQGRTLEEIAERGGLDPVELVAVLENRPARWMGQIEAVDRLIELIRDSPGAP